MAEVMSLGMQQRSPGGTAVDFLHGAPFPFGF